MANKDGRDVRGRFVSGHNMKGVRNGEHGKFVATPKDINTNSGNIVITKTEVNEMFEQDETSRTGVIRNVLMEGTETIEQAVEKVIAQRPGDDAKKIEKQIKNILRKTDQGKKPWTDFQTVAGKVQIVPKEGIAGEDEVTVKNEDVQENDVEVEKTEDVQD